MYNTLGQKLRHASQKCFEDGKLSEDEKHKYFMSVTEEEILTGLLKLPGNISEQCMCFVRIFENIDLNDKVAPRFIDMLQDKTIDEEAQKILQLLRDEKVANKINNKETNFSRYSIVYCIWCTLVNVCLANFQYFGFERTWWRLFRLSVPDEGYSGWAYLMKVIPETCRVHEIWYLHLKGHIPVLYLNNINLMFSWKVDYWLAKGHLLTINGRPFVYQYMLPFICKNHDDDLS